MPVRSIVSNAFAARMLAALTVLALVAAPLRAQERFVQQSTGATSAQVATAQHGMVVSQEQQATRIGLDVLKHGGNAVDAAVAVGFALAVSLPKAGNIGGGGFMVVHLAGRNEDVAIDYREIAPAATRADVFLDPDGQADPRKSTDTGLGVGVPGTVAGLSLALERFGSGKFTLAELIAPAIRLAREGVPVKDDLFDSLLLAQPRLAQWPSSVRIFLKPDGAPPAQGAILVQSDLADTLEAIGRDGPRAFYVGPIADKIVAAVRGAGGVMVRGDLENYGPVIRKPVRGTYRGYDIVAMPPPSSGGIHLIEMLNILEGYPSQRVSDGSAAALHLQIEAMKLAYADRAAYLGDSDHVDVPLDWLISKDHAAGLRGLIDPNAHPPGARTAAGHCGTRQRQHHPFLGGRPGRQRRRQHLFAQFQLRGWPRRRRHRHHAQQRARRFRRQARRPERVRPPRRRRQCAGAGQTAAVVHDPHHRAQGRQARAGHRRPRRQPHHHHRAAGDRQRLDGHKPIGDAVAAPRLHHQWWPDEVVVERNFPANRVRGLTALGHMVTAGPLFGSAHSIAVTAHGLTGAADLRARGAAAAGY